MSAIDAKTKNLAGGQITQPHQLTSIGVSLSGSTLWTYALAYETAAATQRLRLHTITEGGLNGDSLLPTTITYQEGTAQDGTVGIPAPSIATGVTNSNGTVYSADIDGDGRQDLIYAVTSGSNYLWYVEFAGSTQPVNTGISTTGSANLLIDNFNGKLGNEFLAPYNNYWYLYTYNGTSFTQTPTNIQVVASSIYASVDIDGDGLPDLVSLATGVIGNVPTTIQLNTTGTSGTVSFAAPVTTTSTIPKCCQAPGALNGSTFYGDNKFPNTPIRKADFDGDGRTDPVVVYAWTGPHQSGGTNVNGLLSRGTAGFVTGTLIDSTLDGKFALANFNDDNCTDVVADYWIAVSKCNGDFGSTIASPGAATLALDWNGDGRTDVLIKNSSGNWNVYISLGSSLANPISTSISVGSGTWAVTDQDGDGLDDLVSSNSNIYVGLHKGAGIKPDLATTFADGYGNYFTPTYVPLSGSTNVYSVGAQQTWPKQNYVGPMYVVPSYLASDGIGGGYTISKIYNLGVMDMTGRGFEGFYSIRTLDSRTGFFNYKYFEQGFPLTGMVSVDNTTQNNTAKLITQISYRNRSISAANVGSFPYVSRATYLQYEMGGAEDATLITTKVVSTGDPGTGPVRNFVC